MGFAITTENRVQFVDSNDWIADRRESVLINALAQSDADILGCCFHLYIYTLRTRVFIKAVY
jgi:hypothetical protein